MRPDEARPLRLLPLLGELPGAHRAQPQGRRITSACRSTCSRASRRTRPIAPRNPQGFVPMLEADGQRITQSLAIIDWLDAALSRAAAAARRSGRPRPCPRAGADHRRRHPPAQQSARAEAARGARPRPGGARRLVPALDQAKASTRWRRSPRRAPAASCSATRVTLADICLVPQMFNARRFDVAARPYPTLVRGRRRGRRARPLRRRPPGPGRALERDGVEQVDLRPLPGGRGRVDLELEAGGLLRREQGAEPVLVLVPFLADAARRLALGDLLVALLDLGPPVLVPLALWRWASIAGERRR